ncbi:MULTISPECIES: DUF6160 family protein [unclassified Oleiphilus]|jgi:hypothetical protein|uniref:DUF6160 family protein n=1 Tax=unclassified Oleiphilus TaxID=2631174 RepID=UPI0007C2DF34|nr:MULTISPECIES: DUF6160 family protein [unclassified Oleiphilus]KZY45954.1 hypothetical protein A3732_08735 [Oleiphilus sp. HI0050]KZY60279.1 hypothetical protein A3735_13140 [Oleiphilus sp. HI0061]KZY73596.1 hypothetical protein A3740_18660 [Oleiphilus sp. HI0068]KZY81767.1 hypothetical protein A3741_04180 [Oleiphilus sp. HI0069]KZY85648.1 hypothetical protein A3743_18775 [Oleiphilus sp. HI0072]KZZ11878.1 hypothetical protein A3749_07760 [Oleiphilus sp. HI0078]KZZ28431.1 hypothetical prote
MMCFKLRYQLLALSLLALSSFSSAELKELDDQSLEEQKGQAGITIDIEYKLSIGQILYKFGDSGNGKSRKQQDYNIPEPPRIVYVLSDDK